MPEYPWFFDGSADKPNARGLAIMTYVQWLGSWQESYPYYEAYVESALPKPEPAEADAEAAEDEAPEGMADEAEPAAEAPAGDAAPAAETPAAEGAAPAEATPTEAPK
jgi:hypothetical protein